MPVPHTRKAPSKAALAGNKKPRLGNTERSKPVRKGTPPPKLRSKPKSELHAVSFAAKAEDPATTRRRDTKGKAKATSAQLGAAEDSTTTTLPSTFKVIAGSYEKLLYGLEGSVSVEGTSYKFSLKPLFIFPAHISYLKAVAASPNGGKWLATGSTDEIIKVWDLRRRKEIGGLMHHEGSITHLEFPSRSHLLSASEDGSLCLFHARDWTVLRTLKGHKGRVNSVAVHPSGKVALSVGKDRTLRMWDLMRGKGSASTKLGKEGELVRWSTDGSLFVVQTQSTMDIYSTDMSLLHTINHPSRLHDVKFCRRVDGEGELLLAAAENKKLTIYDVPADKAKMPTPVAYMVGHTNRVKAVDTLKIALPVIPGTSRSWTTVASTISSDGRVRLYDLSVVPLEVSSELPEFSPIVEYDSKGSRLTCIALADGDTAPAATIGKRKREKADEETGADEDDEQDEWNPSNQREDEEASEDETSELEGEQEAEEENVEEEDVEEV
ncbi:hypothetical protein NM688_g2897 [Phlebia brevispora]|uniref:Uncharacterized protein n=1 Tax=Phlebia brevispora TaxID=194682 RepID=A0ACC1T7H7_9APHY|nr:hypothetical protein NM688_g2897 [Phlebia brevispora]